MQILYAKSQSSTLEACIEICVLCMQNLIQIIIDIVALGSRQIYT
jgi:hypothetical protein